MTDENALDGMGRVMGSAGGGITLQIEKKAEKQRYSTFGFQRSEETGI